MDRHFDEQFWAGLKQERRRIYALMIGLVCFAIAMLFTQVADHYLAIGVSCFTFVLFIMIVRYGGSTSRVRSSFKSAAVQNSLPAGPGQRFAFSLLLCRQEAPWPAGLRGRDRCPPCRRVHDGAERIAPMVSSEVLRLRLAALLAETEKLPPPDRSQALTRAWDLRK